MPRTRVPAALLSLALLAGCGDDEIEPAETGDPPETTTTAPETTTTSTDDADETSSTTSTTAEVAVTTPSTTPAETDAEELADAPYMAFLDAVDPAARTLSVDVVQFLTGEEAIAAYREATPEDDAGFPPNDYFIVDDSPRIRILPVAPDAPVQVLADPGAPELRPGTLEDLLERIRTGPFLLQVEGGEITAITQQYLP